MLQFVMLGLFELLLIVGLGLFIAIIALAISIISRVWPNYITPWLDKHFGESDWDW